MPSFSSGVDGNARQALGNRGNGIPFAGDRISPDVRCNRYSRSEQVRHLHIVILDHHNVAFTADVYDLVS